MKSKTNFSGECPTSGCENYATHKGQLCRHHQGLANDKALVAKRKKAGLPIRPMLGSFLLFHKAIVRKSKPKVTPIKRQVISKVPVLQVKLGMTIAPDHGEVTNSKSYQARKLVGKKHVKGGAHGILFITTRHTRGIWFPLDSEVCIVKGVK